MNMEPKIENRPEQPYLAIRTKVQMAEIPTKLPPLIPEIYEWLETHKIQPAGPVFFNYLDMDNGIMTAEVGVPVEVLHAGDARVSAGTFPAGRYAVYTHMGNYTQIPEAHMALGTWARQNNIQLLNPCIEFYPTDPAIKPDPAHWQTDIVRRLPAEKN
ncbi:GyrI-like domain-containing protein [Adhaeribacter soli]|uniref:GyrI-like domain-containing protein n=1 Tax=Adhaeribacter soli TaxID=2607655 RepID=A0A5N1J609_9BACT|nr:GyrI-like domain-containing protein [Adhaeribacter soli]KAA9345603.1 GyrI-like domain-containing protein [Adhaeribacter soli]